MKVIISFFATLFSVAAFASPNIGDYSQMSGQIVDSGTAIKFEQTVVDLTPSQILVKEVGTDTSLGETDVSQQWQLREDVLALDQVNMILTDCTRFGGNSESVDIGIGTFDTCKLQDGPTIIWVGRVPFGVVKLDTPMDGLGRVVAEISDYRFGAK